MSTAESVCRERVQVREAADRWLLPLIDKIYRNVRFVSHLTYTVLATCVIWKFYTRTVRYAWPAKRRFYINRHKDNACL
jgi:hypothetical protein